MRIVNMKNFPYFFQHGGSKTYRGFAVINESGKFLSLNGKDIYIPAGGRKVLKELLPIVDQFSFVELH